MKSLFARLLNKSSPSGDDGLNVIEMLREEEALVRGG